MCESTEKMLVVTFGMFLILNAAVSGEFLVVTHNGPVVLGATVTVRAKVHDDRPNKSIQPIRTCEFWFSDDAEPSNQFLVVLMGGAHRRSCAGSPPGCNVFQGFHTLDGVDGLQDLSRSCSTEWAVTYQPGVHESGEYAISVVAYIRSGTHSRLVSRANTTVRITPYLNGEIELYQNGAALDYDQPAFLHSKVSARVNLSAPDAELLSRMGASFKTDWSFEIEAPEKRNGRYLPGMARVWAWTKNGQPGASFDQTFTAYHGCYVEVRARLCAAVPNNTDLAPLGHTYGFFYRRFLLLDPIAATALSNFTVETNQKSGSAVVIDDQVDALIIEQ